MIRGTGAEDVPVPVRDTPDTRFNKDASHPEQLKRKAGGNRRQAGHRAWLKDAWIETVSSWHRAASLAHELDLVERMQAAVTASDPVRALPHGWHSLGQGVWMHATTYSEALVTPSESARTAGGGALPCDRLTASESLSP